MATTRTAPRERAPLDFPPAVARFRAALAKVRAGDEPRARLAPSTLARFHRELDDYLAFWQIAGPARVDELADTIARLNAETDAETESCDDGR